jgi:hypothetical protein
MVLSLLALSACSNGEQRDGGPEPVDAAADAVEDTSLPGDAGMVSFTSTVRPEQLVQGCMPAVPSDPLVFQGALVVVNTGTVPVGPITVGAGSIVSVSGMELARFALEPATLPVLAPGAMHEVALTKQPDSLQPAEGCIESACTEMVRVRVALEGPGVPAGGSASSPLTRAMCLR